MKDKLPTIFITHGGGPCFFMDWNPKDAWKKMELWFRNLSSTFKTQPKAILLISGHWEEDNLTILTNPNPPLLYDYYGFPEHTYELKYPAPNSLEVVEKVKKLLSEKNFVVKSDDKRGFDHGVFIPLKLIYPEANIPVVQLSLKTDLDPATHIQIGKVLSSLREEGVLIIGSGSSYHNLRAFGPSGALVSQKFDDWLTEVVLTQDKEEREHELNNWDRLALGRKAHPREEHLLPLMVVAGSAYENETGKKTFSDNIMGVTLSCFEFS